MAEAFRLNAQFYLGLGLGFMAGAVIGRAFL